MKDLVSFLLHNQYVGITIDGVEAVWQVTAGSGMGMLSSDELSTLDFYVKCEKDFACDSGVQKTHGVLGYYRFKDDILVVFDFSGEYERARELMMSFLRGMKSRSKVYNLKVDEISSSGVAMLDVNIQVRRHNSCNMFDFSIFRKVTAQGVPLHI